MANTVEESGLQRIVRNTGWLLGGKTFAAVASVAYLAILSRSLGLRGFGHFSLILGTAQALVAIVGFQTWQTVVRFGAAPIRSDNIGAFARLVFFCAGLDYAGALVGTILSAIIFFVLAEPLSLNPDYIWPGFLFTSVLLWARVSTPQGVVRALDRFDLGTYIEAISPAGRLLASLAIAATGPTVIKFLIAWAAFDVLASVAYWIAAHRITRGGLRWKHARRVRVALRENKGMLPFFGVTYANTSLDALVKQGPLLLVGALIGTSAAGVYRLADQLAQGVGKLAQILTRAVFPEFVRAEHGLDPKLFRQLLRQVTVIAGIGAVIVTAIALLYSEHLMVLIGGDAFAVGAGILLALAIGASFELAGLSYEPLLYATGFQRYPLIARGVAIVALAVGIWIARDSGGEGIAWAVAVAKFIGYALVGFAAARVVRRRGNGTV